tara:strand:- start:216 stop:671 length:456 start_codon:yes stop_codon:yes gene_type:complete
MGSSLILDNNFDNLNFSSLRIGIIQSEWNSKITNLLMTSCRNYFLEIGINDKNITTRKVPGSMELVYASNHMFFNHDVDGIVILGCIIKGETDHDKYIANAVSKGLVSVSLSHNKPISFGLLTTNNFKQAISRSGGGKESAYTLLKMLNLD